MAKRLLIEIILVIYLIMLYCLRPQSAIKGGESR